MPQYIYKDIEKGEIKLLKLRQNFWWPFPRCTLVAYPSRRNPPYEAISYTWGASKPAFPIEDDNQQLLVIRSIAEVIRYRQSVFKARFLWIDTICINQENYDEKSHQLPLMRDIYNKASKVYIWLGPPTLKSATARSFQDVAISNICSRHQSLCV